MTDTPRRILILHAQAGAGHKRAAESLEAAFRASDGSIRVHALDTMTFASKLFKKTYAQTYNTLAQHAPQFWGLLYWGSEQKGVHKGTAPARMQVDRINLRRLVKAIERFRPVAIICTHFLPLGPLADLAQKNRLGAPLYSVVTDFGAHPMWVFRGVTGYFVASAEVREDLAEWGVPWETVWVTGIPIDLRFSEKTEKREARIALGLEPDRPVALIMGGGNGVGPLYEMAERIVGSRAQPQVVVISGRNEKMKETIDELAARHPGRVRSIGFTREVDRWLDTADLNVTKAGGLTCSESLAKQVPMVIFRPTPGQEDRNSQALTTVGAALRARDLDQVVEAVDRILTRPELAQSMREACRFLGRPHAGPDIVKEVLREAAFHRSPASDADSADLSTGTE